MPYELHIYAQFVQNILEEDKLGRKADKHISAAMSLAHQDLIGHGGQVIGAVGRGFRIGQDGLSGVTEGRQSFAEFFQLGHTGRGCIGP